VTSLRGKLLAGDFGSIKTQSGADMSHRLDMIYGGIREVIAGLVPDVVALEQLFFNTNLKTAVAVGQARGVILLACRHSEVSCAEYTPLQVKMAVTGSGNAAKEQVQYMVRALLGLKDMPGSLHASDALAIAICHLNSCRIQEKTGT
jgi:crossover junction endodeoxyribonuclease RuvC